MTLDPEMARILALPVVDPTPAAGSVLRPAQVRCLDAWCEALRAPSDPVWGPPGLAALLGCGHGKTLVSLLLPALAGHPRTVHLTPAALLPQLDADLTAWLPALPDLESQGRTFVSHEYLSARAGKGLLLREEPELIVIDEAHGFADPNSGRWRRLAQYLDERPATRVAILSGSLSWRSLYQAQHLLVAALRAWAPVPRGPTIAPWAACVDVGSDPAPEDRAVLRPLCAWARTPDPRAAYRRRLTTCPGVVVTGDAGAPTSLRVVALAGPRRAAGVVEAVRLLETAWSLPDGTDLVSALEVHRHARTLALGLWQRWRPETVSLDWLGRRRAWASEARILVEYGGAQTLADAADLARAGRVRPAARAAWDRWAEVAHYPGPETEDVWLDGRATIRGTVQASVLGAPPTVIWTATPAIGWAAAQALGARYHGAGSEAPTGGRHAASSYRVHGKGWNGQAYARAVVLESPSSGATWEQLLARHHRQGQDRDVEVHVLLRDRVHHAALRSGVADARFVHDTTGAEQRLLLCDCVGWRRDAGRGAPREANGSDGALGK